VHDVVEATGATFLVLEYVEGGDLRGVLARRGPLPPREADALLAGVLEGLDAVHAQGIVHGDLKPENVLLTGRGEAKLADFGVARRGASSTLVAGAGTLAYMAPEQARGLAPTPQSDLYAAALLYREMLTGEPPAPRGLDDVQLRGLVAQRQASHAIPGARGAILTRALAHDPAARYASARDVLDALSALG
jgi:serine/threonine protein kinase